MMGKKISKNLSKVQSMLDGTFGGHKSQVGYTPDKIDRKPGDVWTDSEGIKWEQKKGYRVRVSANVGIFRYQCKDCKKNCGNRKLDKDTWKRFERCYYCQIDFEAVLQGMGKWDFWVRLQELNRYYAMEYEMEQWIFNKDSEEMISAFESSVANAIANEELEGTFKINKNLTGG